jgi:ribosomal protein S18 acetylase RimI-like enzyme
MITIKELGKDRFDHFITYLERHLLENGQAGATLFLPLSKEQSILSKELKEKFESGLNKKAGDAGWRKTWIAIDQEDTIAGHIDIRPHNQLNADHRVLLGMGVDRRFRGLKIGQELMRTAIEYCTNDPAISWIDLHVMTNNVPALKLYGKMNFIKLCNTADMFRINNTSYDYTTMTLKVES